MGRLVNCIGWGCLLIYCGGVFWGGGGGCCGSCTGACDWLAVVQEMG